MNYQEPQSSMQPDILSIKYDLWCCMCLCSRPVGTGESRLWQQMAHDKGRFLLQNAGCPQRHKGGLWLDPASLIPLLFFPYIIWPSRQFTGASEGVPQSGGGSGGRCFFYQGPLPVPPPPFSAAWNQAKLPQFSPLPKE
ncbi:UNVERIFIED_CONTAM: hypothetical protein K2H54_011797 [Gekko kuhli]